MKKVEEDGSRGRDPERSGVSSRSVTVQRDKPTSDVCFSKIVFLAFIARLITSTAGMEHKSQKIKVFGCARFDVRRVTRCVKWWCPILSGCWPEVGLNIFK